MKILRQSLWIGLICLLWLGDAASQVAPQEGVAPRPPFWSIYQPGEAVARGYLLGSVHAGRRQWYPLSPAIEAAFDHADTLVVEVDITRLDLAQVTQLTLARGLYTDGRQLAAVIGDEQWQRLADAVTVAGYPSALFTYQKPWFAALTLAALALQQEGYQQAWGVDRYLLERAHERAMVVVSLETLEQQLALFDHLDAADQLALLQQALGEFADPSYLHRLMAAWLEGDLAALERLVNTAVVTASPRLFQALIIDRNRAMLNTILALLERESRPFVVVGAGHTAGAEGLAALLRARGYELR